MVSDISELHPRCPLLLKIEKSAKWAIFEQVLKTTFLHFLTNSTIYFLFFVTSFYKKKKKKNQKTNKNNKNNKNKQEKKKKIYKTKPTNKINNLAKPSGLSKKIVFQ